ncbi:hypothetical protein NG797_26490 [Laspinema sp. D5]|nr:hypothetical protein [Laspinema sp. D3d]
MPSNPKVILLPMEKMGHSFKVIGHSAPNRLQKNGLCVRGDRSISNEVIALNVSSRTLMGVLVFQVLKMNT